MPGGRKPKDGRANNGGARQGQSGGQYANRSDLRTQKISVPPSSEYGQGEALRRSQQVVPMAGAPAAPQPAGGAGPTPAYAYPEDTPTLTAPTNRPGEPVEDGMPFGPGSSPAPRSAQPMSDTEVRLRALYARFPTRELRELIDQIDMQ